MGKFWFRVKDVYQSKKRVTYMNSELYYISVCPILQIIAVLEKSTARLYVYSANYKLLAQTDLQILPSLLVGFYWNQCCINIILSDGQMHSLELRSGSLFGSFRFTTKRTLPGGSILAVSYRRENFAIVTSKMTVLIGKTLLKTTRGSSIMSICLLGDQSVLAGLESGALVLLTANSEPLFLFSTSLPGEVFSQLSLSFSGQFVAAYTSRGSILVFSTSDFIPNCSVKPIECTALDMGAAVPRSLAWVGDDCLALVFGNQLFLGGLGGDWAPYEYEEEIFLNSDMHCATVMSGRKFQTISRVQPSTFLFSQPESPVNKLVFGYKKFVENNVQSESTIRSLGSDLGIAVTQCVEAALFETDEKVIGLLLRASIFGRKFLKPQSTAVAASKSFVTSVGLLRVASEMNRQGVPVSVPQIAEAGSLVVAYAAATGQYLLANRLARWMGIEHNSTAWAIELIHSGAHLTDNDLCEMIESKGTCNLVEISEFAFASGRKNLATLLLNSEVRVGEQVRLLLSLGALDMAIGKAAAVEDVELIHQCLDRVVANKDPIPSTGNSPLVLSLVAARHQTEGKHEDLCKLLQAIPNAEPQLAAASLALAASKPAGPAAASWMQYSAQRYASVMDSKGAQLMAHFLSESSLLITAQIELEKKFKKLSLVGLSLDETLATLILAGESVEADTLRGKRKMSDGRFWDLHVQTLITADRLGEAISFVNKVPPPTTDCRGFKTVVQCLVAAKRDDLALPFIRKLRKSKQQAHFFSLLGLHDEARLASEQRGLLGRFGW